MPVMIAVIPIGLIVIAVIALLVWAAVKDQGNK